MNKALTIDQHIEKQSKEIFSKIKRDVRSINSSVFSTCDLKTFLAITKLVSECASECRKCISQSRKTDPYKFTDSLISISKIKL